LEADYLRFLLKVPKTAKENQVDVEFDFPQGLREGKVNFRYYSLSLVDGNIFAYPDHAYTQDHNSANTNPEGSIYSLPLVFYTCFQSYSTRRYGVNTLPFY
jgi:hypothetical protein